MAIPSSHINGFDELLRKFHEGNISSEEYARLSKAMKATSDFELHKMLEEHWETFEEYEELAEDKIDLLYNKGIKPQLHISEEHSIGIRLKRY